VSESLPYQVLADMVLSLHVAIVTFVVGGLAFIIVGNLQSWRWANALWFRLAHLVAIAVVVAEAWLGIVCPLTSVEMWLRTKARATIYTGSFIEHWLERILYYEAPTWVFTAGYSLFGLVVAATWWYFPPKPSRRTHETDA
jgi:polyferredoxin